MSKYTLGPWSVENDTLRIVNEYGVTVANCGPCASSPQYLAEHRANARLIAASPELLSVLKTVLDDYKQPDWVNLKRNIKLMEDAIAKAEGD